MEAALVKLCEGGDRDAIKWTLANMRPRDWHMEPQPMPRRKYTAEKNDLFSVLRAGVGDLGDITADEPQQTKGPVPGEEEEFITDEWDDC